MEPSSAASSARCRLICVASFGLITGACAFIGYYVVRRYRRSSDLDSAGRLSSETKNGCPADEETPNDRQDTGVESKKTEVVSNEAAKQSPKDEDYETKGLDGGELRSENRDIDTNKDSVAESNKLDSSVTGIERDAIRDVGLTRSSHTSNANDTQCKGVERPVAVDSGDTLPGKRKVFSAGTTHFLDETNGGLLSLDSAKGTQQSQKQDSWSETVIVGSGKDSTSAIESENLLCQSQVNGLNADRTDEDIEARRTQRKLKANAHLSTHHKEALNQKTHFLNSNDDDNDSNLGTDDRQNGEAKISEVDAFSGDQSAKTGRILKTGKAVASFTKSSTSQGIDKDHGVRPHQLSTAGSGTPTAKSALPLPLTPPPDAGTSRRQRGGRGGQTAPSKQPRGAGGQSGRSGRRRWSPPEDKTAAENVELDASSQQASWTANRATAAATATSSSSSPWTVGDGVMTAEEASTVPDPARKVEFDDNFVVDAAAAAKKGFDGEASSSSSSSAPERRSQPPGVARRSSGGGPAKNIGSLVQAPPECVLERKPLISENEEEEEDEGDDDDDGHLFADHHQRSKRTEEEETTEKVATVQDLSIPNAEEGKKLVHIDENCVDSLVQLLAKEAAGMDTAVQLASLRALVNLSWTTEKHGAYTPVIDRLFATVDSRDPRLRLESLRVLANLSKNPEMVSYLLAAKAPDCLLKMLTPDMDEDVLTLWLGVLDDVLWTSKELCLTYASLPSERRAASPETVYTGLYGLKNSRILKSRIFVLSRHRSQQVTYLASHIYSCLTT